MARHVTSSENVGVGGPAKLIDDDAVIDRKSRRAREIIIGGDAHADHRGRNFKRGTIRQLRPLKAPRSLEARDSTV